MVRDTFHQKLEHLNQDLLKMGSMVEEAIHKAVTSLMEQDLELAKEVIANDDTLDDYEAKIEQECIQLIALQQPVAKDLRRIDMISKVVTDLERIGDLAQNIAMVTCELKSDKFVKPLVDIPRMAEIAQEMLRECLDAFVNSDVDKARNTAQMDDKVDMLDSQIFRELLTYMMEDPKSIRQGNYLLFVSRYLERAADHATNICERVIYMITADRESY
ncbi:phosphate transport system regulatory protein PhoU [Orenia metallireducens]|uniref:Phosphate-specific transport system accessory protein PhoU n=1 Tax=Orenia metallireducens TaxID=1413210 RepID=A0A1C0AAL5_9FIRM|nr:phosphate signaling complex protein PhoU [Orenia metallireducens]OCL27303.1 phosphate transport system regulatory protein PhoU [Orenia metallireducens]